LEFEEGVRKGSSRRLPPPRGRLIGLGLPGSLDGRVSFQVPVFGGGEAYCDKDRRHCQASTTYISDEDIVQEVKDWVEDPSTLEPEK
jgi:hypothetical protein